MQFNQPKLQLLKASIFVTVISLSGKLIGFVRDVVIAAYYGANWQTDAFFFAQSMPSIIFPAVCNSLSTAFLSVYVSKSVDDKRNADTYASNILLFSVFLTIGLSILVIILSPVLVPLLAPGFSDIQDVLAIHLTRITMGAFVLIMIQYMLGAILSARKLYYGAQIAALLYNLCVILITVLLGPGQNMDMLTITVVIGHLIQVVSLVVFLRKHFGFHPTKHFLDNETQKLITLTLPILVGNSIVQINNIVDKILSSLFGDGAMSALSYSNTLNRFVTGIVITTLSTVIYPVMTEKYSKDDRESFTETICSSISIGVIVLAPISVITSTCAQDIVGFVYERGNFDTNAAKLTSFALAFYGFMYVFSAVQEIITRVFYAMKDTKTPLRAASFAILANAFLSILFSRFWQLGGIALGTTLSTLFAAVLLLLALKKRVADINIKRIVPTLLKNAVSTIVLLGIIIVLKNTFSDLKAFPRFFVISIICFFAHTILLAVMKCKEMLKLADLFGNRLKRFKHSL